VDRADWGANHSFRGDSDATIRRVLEDRGLIWLLRDMGDEVQFNDALSFVCQREEGAARRFVDGLLAADDDDTSVRVRRDELRRRLTELPELRCTDQVPTEAVRTRLWRRKQRELGRSDLRFRAGDVVIVVELKIDAVMAPGQLEKYLRSKEQPFVAAVVRPTKQHAIALEHLSSDGQSRWLGVVTWTKMRGVLEELLETPGRLRDQWRELLTVMDDHGDFAETPAKPKEGTTRLEDLKAEIVESFSSIMGDPSSRRDDLSERAIDATTAATFDRGWAWLELPRLSVTGRAWVSIRQSGGVVTRVRVIWDPPPTRARRKSTRSSFCLRIFTGTTMGRGTPGRAPRCRHDPMPRCCRRSLTALSRGATCGSRSEAVPEICPSSRGAHTVA
jgi:hypothetical protein